MSRIAHPESNSKSADERVNTHLVYSPGGTPETEEVLANTAATTYAQLLRDLRKERCMSTRALADKMRYSQARISHVETGRQAPSEDFTRAAENALDANGALWAAFDRLHTPATAPAPIERDLRLTGFVSWLAEHSDRNFGALYQAVSARAAHLDAEPSSTRHGRAHTLAQITSDDITDALHQRYGASGFASITVNGWPVRLGMFTDPTWMHPTTLGSGKERIRFEPPEPTAVHLDAVTVDAAVERLARAEVDRTVMINNPLYRLVACDPTDGIDATFTTVDFAEYALTADMLSDELTATIADGTTETPLRDRYLPDIAATVAWGERVCVGGPNVLVAVARPGRGDEPGDYVVFVQERSTNVVNQPGQLAVVPKAFHQPTGEMADEVHLSTTVRREMEEELLGREDLELLEHEGRHRSVDPMHEGLITAPLAWLMQRPEAYRTEACGFAVNMVNGNFDVPCLVVIDDPEWWGKFGHMVEANWESDRVRRYSTRDTAGLTALIGQPRWSTEGLFAFLVGLARLAEVGDPERLALPEITVGVL